jgi:hypothetical protein
MLFRNENDRAAWSNVRKAINLAVHGLSVASLLVSS